MSALMGHHPVNLTLPERVARVIVGGLGALGGIAWLVLVPTALVAVGAVLLAAAGLDLVVTGARGDRIRCRCTSARARVATAADQCRAVVPLSICCDAVYSAGACIAESQ